MNILSFQEHSLKTSLEGLHSDKYPELMWESQLRDSSFIPIATGIRQWVLVILSILLNLLFVITACAQKENAAIFSGNKLYKEGKFTKSLEEYQKAVQQNPRNAIAWYNLGNALYRENNFSEAEKAFDEIFAITSDQQIIQKAYYNKGVSLTKEKKLLESIEAYKEAVILNPADEDARFNLQKALEEWKKQNQPNKKPKQQQQQQQKKQQPPPSKLNKKQIEQYLKSLQQKEQEVQQKMQQNRARVPKQPDKDW